MKVEGSMDKFYQYAFPMSTVLVTCNDDTGKTNIITIAWHTTISKNPPLYGISIAPSRYSHELIKKNQEFVINFVPFELVDKAHFCGTHSGRRTDKSSETGLTLSSSKKVKIPLINECYAHLECELKKSITIGDHTLLIGEVLAVQTDEEVFENDVLAIYKIQPLFYLGGNSYSAIDGKKKKDY